MRHSIAGNGLGQRAGMPSGIGVPAPTKGRAWIIQCCCTHVAKGAGALNSRPTHVPIAAQGAAVAQTALTLAFLLLLRVE